MELERFVSMIEALLTEIGHLASTTWWEQNSVALLNILIIDLVLAGDNAIVVGLAASRVDKSIRNQVIFWGIAAAVVLRILFAALTTQLLAIGGIMILGGGLLLLWVSWKMYRQVVVGEHEHVEAVDGGGGVPLPHLGFWPAVWTITLADVSMSLDNVLAVAGAAKGSTLVLVIGLAVAIILMALASRLIASLLVKYPWITWIGLLIIVYVALDMIFSGTTQLACEHSNMLCDWVPKHVHISVDGLTVPAAPEPAPVAP
ncbi:YjbE family putative metal transport protein [Hyphomicrobium sp.]|uniref:YjbE family putative metal transport protein n=1 Tax=Hyphomicrobium sp. TaxID=82 RepID=UPI003F6F17A4